MPAAAETLRSGPPELRRPTIALAITQLVSWGVLYYTFPVVAPAMVRESGWSVTQVSGAFSAGLLVSGLSAPSVAAMLGRHGPRTVMTAGSILTVLSMMLWASAPSVVTLYAAWMLIGIAMAGTLYEPAIIVLTQLDSQHMRRTISIVMVAGGLASTIFVPLTEYLVEILDWRVAVAVLGGSGGAIAAALHSRYLPRHTGADSDSVPLPHTVTRPMHRLHIAYVLEQGSTVAGTALIVTMLIDRGVDPHVAALVLAVMGGGKVGGRLLLAGRIGQTPPQLLAARGRLARDGRRRNARDHFDGVANHCRACFWCCDWNQQCPKAAHRRRACSTAHLRVGQCQAADLDDTGPRSWTGDRCRRRPLCRMDRGVGACRRRPRSCRRHIRGSRKIVPESEVRTFPIGGWEKNERGGGCLCLEVRQNAV